jgi:hypothetical protein
MMHVRYSQHGHGSSGFREKLALRKDPGRVWGMAQIPALTILVTDENPSARRQPRHLEMGGGTR